MKVGVSLACEFIETFFIFEGTHRIGNCDKRLLPLLRPSVRTKALDVLRSAGLP
jgi:hypothetical protein